MVIVETTELEVVPCTSLDTWDRDRHTRRSRRHVPSARHEPRPLLVPGLRHPISLSGSVFPKPPQTSKWGNGRGSREDSGRV